MRTDLLKIKMVEENVRGEALAEAAEMDQSTFYRKMGSDGNNFTVKQAQLISKALNLTKEEACDIFLA